MIQQVKGPVVNGEIRYIHIIRVGLGLRKISTSECTYNIVLTCQHKTSVEKKCILHVARQYRHYETSPEAAALSVLFFSFASFLSFLSRFRSAFSSGVSDPAQSFTFSFFSFFSFPFFGTLISP